MAPPKLRTPEAERQWRNFYKTAWHKAAVRSGKCPGCGRRKRGKGLQHVRCSVCRRKHRVRERARYHNRRSA